MNKRGVYFFVVDAFIGASIVLISLLVVLNSYAYSPAAEQPLTTLEDFITYLQNTQVRDFEGNFTQIYLATNRIDHPSNTLYEQIAEFNNESDFEANTNFTGEIVAATLPTQMSMRYTFGDQLVYEKARIPLEESGLSLSSKKVAMVGINETHSYGPHLVEVIIWTS